MASPWIKAIRLRTLPLAWASLSMGAILAAMQGAFDWLIYTLSLLTAFSLQILSNLANDYGDAESGLDGANRQGPSRTIQDGLITKTKMKRAIWLTVVFSLLFGISLLSIALVDWLLIGVFLLFGVMAILAAVKYTMGDNPYGYAGWGDFFVLVFFGWVGVSGSLFLFTQSFEAVYMLPASSLGLFAVAVLNVNNIRDIDSDKASGKFSIPVRIGRSRAVVYHSLILISGLGASIWFGIIQEFEGLNWLFLAVSPLMMLHWLKVKKTTDPKAIDPYLKQMALMTLLFVILFWVGTVGFG